MELVRGTGATLANAAGGEPFELGFYHPQGMRTGRRPPVGTLSMSFASDQWRIPYTQQADIAIEHQLARDTLLTASYIWSRGVAFTTVRDANVGPHGAPVTYRINDATGAQVGSYTTPTYLRANRVDPRYLRVGVLESDGNHYYNALALQLRKRQSRWLEAQASYTWSHALDYNLGATGDNLFFGSVPRTVFNGAVRNEKGTSELDQRHRLVVNFVSDMRFGIRQPVLRLLADDWQLSGIHTYASGTFATPFIFVSGVPFAGAAFNSTVNGLGGATRVPFLPRTSMPIDVIHRADVRLSKIFPFNDKLRLMFMFEVFNVTNSQNDTAVRAQAFQATAGVLAPTPRLNEGMASAGFPDGTNARRAQIALRLFF
jgi:hypothetical protein